jgi:hypothetical protein
MGDWTTHDDKKKIVKVSLRCDLSLSSTARLRLAILQNPRRGRRVGLELGYLGLVLRREIPKPLLREGVGVFGETAAAFCLLL